MRENHQKGEAVTSLLWCWRLQLSIYESCRDARFSWRLPPEWGNSRNLSITPYFRRREYSVEFRLCWLLASNHPFLAWAPDSISCSSQQSHVTSWLQPPTMFGLTTTLSNYDAALLFPASIAVLTHWTVVWFVSGSPTSAHSYHHPPLPTEICESW